MDYLTLLFTFALALGLSLAGMPLVIALGKRLKMRQTILHYVDAHKQKSGTPTMGGIGFVLATIGAGFVFFDQNNSLAVMSCVVFGAYGVIGFLDDFVKVFFKRNQGLSVWQKIFSQLIVAVVVAMFAYANEHIGSALWLPHLGGSIDLGMWIIPFNVLIFLALTNAVNLTDGLDGLAGSVSVVYLLGFVAVFGLVISVDLSIGDTLAEYRNMMVLIFALIGAVVGFLAYNGFPAKVFMGDTGALALGGVFACLAIFLRMSLIVPIIGIIWVLSSISVLMQVAYYKLTHKRIFLMAPLHHHFEKMGIHENRIVSMYSIATLVCGLGLLAVIMIFGGI